MEVINDRNFDSDDDDNNNKRTIKKNARNRTKRDGRRAEK